ncbi:zinc ribbon domain-containing protein [uncultured Clostridium sp.]|uniref:zinc ribbon domain-containing protein n=1 Tax=uncultured Clostridium sp. TaxID=59620 RepID=UPI0025CDC141|nr:zinc ribbon domain-containing protein [uncultured Clostridium sp.]
MFFIGVFGIEDKQEEIKIIENFSCKNCHCNGKGRLIKEYSFFHFFFIPLFKWNESYYVVCSNCNAVYSISKEKGKAVEQGEDINITYWDLCESNYSSISYNVHNSNICLRCGRSIESDFAFCPYCGEKIIK